MANAITGINTRLTQLQWKRTEVRLGLPFTSFFCFCFCFWEDSVFGSRNLNPKVTGWLAATATATATEMAKGDRLHAIVFVLSVVLSCHAVLLPSSCLSIGYDTGIRIYIDEG